MLGRTPSPAEQSAWVTYVVTGGIESAVAGFLVSSEFEARALTVRDFVTILYRALLGRDPDPSGRQSQESLWTEGLLQGVGNLLIGTSEFQQTLPQLCQS